MKSKVFFIDLRASFKKSFTDKIGELMTTAGIADIIAPRDLTAVKLHFGEMGNTAYIRPVYLRKIVEIIKSAGGHPFLTDANTLYAGTRSDAPHHLDTAVKNGFAYSVVDAPLIIADGLRGKSETAVTVDLKHFMSVYIGSEIVQADCLISVAHFKGHELSGFGGAIKNVGMGCASRHGKMAQHSNLSPRVDGKKCIACAECEAHCAHNAITIENETARINPEACTGCGECIVICPSDAVKIQWNQSIPTFLENMVEYTAGVLKNKTDKALYINFINNVSPGCDCYAHNDAPIVPDIGVVASTDPVAIDQASVDLVNQATALPGTCLKHNTGPGEDKFKGLYPKVDWPIQLDYAEKLGLGSRTYELVQMD